MRKFILALFICASAIGQTVNVNLQKVQSTNQLTAASSPLVVGNGQSITFASGSTLTMASGSTFTPASGSNLVTTDGSYSNPSWITSLAWSKISGAPTFVNTANTYANPTWLTTLDWAKIINAPTFVDTAGSYANPSWITSLAWSKITGAPSGTGTVTSVGLSAPSGFSVSGSPITSSGTLALSFATGQTANSVLATPNGSTGALSIRSLVPTDIPTLTLAKISDAGTAATKDIAFFQTPQTSAAGYGITNGATIDQWGTITPPTSQVFTSKPAHYVLASPTGSAGVPSMRALESSDIPFPTTAAKSLLGNNTDGAIQAVSLNATQVKSMLNIEASDVSGLGDSATRNVGVTAGTVAAGNDPRFRPLPFTALGQTIYSDDAGNAQALNGNTSTTRKFLSQTGTGTESAIPAWTAISPEDLPTPTPSTLGGVYSKAAVSHYFLNQVGTDGVIGTAQPSASDLSNGTTGTGAVALVDSPTFTTKISSPVVQSTSSGGLVLKANNGTTVVTFGMGGSAAAMFADSVSASGFTGPLTGNASTATALQTPRAINGVNFDGTAPITITAATPNALTIGTHLTGTSYDGSAPVTIATDATSANTAGTIVARDGSGNAAVGVPAGTLTGTTLASNVVVKYEVATIAALRATSVSGLASGAGVYVLGYYATNDGGQGRFVYNSSSSATDDGGSVIAPTVGAGRFLRIFDGDPTPLQFGAKGDDATDGTSAVANLTTYAIANKKDVRVPAGTYRLTGWNVTGLSRQRIYGDAGSGAVIKFTNAGNASDPDSTMQTGFFAGNGTTSAISQATFSYLRVEGPSFGASFCLLNSFHCEFDYVSTTKSRHGFALCGAVGAFFHECNTSNSTGYGQVSGIGLINLSGMSGFNDEGQPGLFWNDTIEIECFHVSGTGDGWFAILDHGSKTPFGTRNIRGGTDTNWPYYYAGRHSGGVNITNCYAEVSAYPVYCLLGNDNTGDMPGTTYPKSNFSGGDTYSLHVSNCSFSGYTQALTCDGASYSLIEQSTGTVSGIFIYNHNPVNTVRTSGNFEVSLTGSLIYDDKYSSIYSLSYPATSRRYGGSGFTTAQTQLVRTGLSSTEQRIRLYGKFNGLFKVSITWGGSSGTPVQVVEAYGFARLDASNNVKLVYSYLDTNKYVGSDFYGWTATPEVAFQAGASYMDVCVKGYGGGGNASKVVDVSFLGYTSTVNYTGYTLEPIGTPPTYLASTTIADATNSTDVITQLNALLALLRTQGKLAP